MQLQVRKALQSDMQAILDVVMAAFGDLQGSEITGLVNDLLVDPSAQPLLSLVATTNQEVVGHILFTHATIKPSKQMVSGAILAPLAVHPDFQSQGIGGQLITEGLKQLTVAGVDLVFVLGHPGYYPKYGFHPAGASGFGPPYPIPSRHADAWMVQALRLGIIGQVGGQVVCADALNDPKYWQE